MLALVIVITAVTHAGKLELAHAVAQDMYKILLLATPAVGILTLLSMLVLRVAGLADFSRVISIRSIVFACFDIAAPFCLYPAVNCFVRLHSLKASKSLAVCP
jgi:Zn-dependent protease with chaperone function